jgi:uncharacterized protein (TIGR03083 family)
MDTAVDGPCDVGCHIDSLRREGELLADAAERAGLDAPVPACPGWQVRDLLKHLGYVHRWAAGYVGEQHASRVGRSSEAEILSQGPDDGSLAGWFREGHAALVRTLQAADPGLACWTFLEAPSPLAFWARRQAHETAIHRVDAEQAAAGAGPGAPAGAPAGAPFSPVFAADGVDELIMGFVGRDARRGSWQGPSGILGIHAVDGAGPPVHWRVAAGPGGGLAVSREQGPADCDVIGPASDLYLMLWNRRDASGLDVRGEPGRLAEFRGHFRVTWG